MAISWELWTGPVMWTLAAKIKLLFALEIVAVLVLLVE
jgi:hypothetical protein